MKHKARLCKQQAPATLGPAPSACHAPAHSAQATGTSSVACRSVTPIHIARPLLISHHSSHTLSHSPCQPPYQRWDDSQQSVASSVDTAKVPPNLHTGTCAKTSTLEPAGNLHHHLPRTFRNLQEISTRTGTFRGTFPKPSGNLVGPATGTFPEPFRKPNSKNLPRNCKEPIVPEPTTEPLWNLHRNLPEPSGTFNLPRTATATFPGTFLEPSVTCS